MTLQTSPITPRAATVGAVATGGTAVTAFSAPANGFLLQNTNASATLFWSLTGAAATTAGQSGSVVTHELAAGAEILFDGPLAAGVSLSCNAAAAQGFACTVW